MFSSRVNLTRLSITFCKVITYSIVFLLSQIFVNSTVSKMNQTEIGLLGTLASQNMCLYVGFFINQIINEDTFFDLFGIYKFHRTNEQYFFR